MSVKPVFSDAPYWKQRWADNKITFHLDQKNPMLAKHLDKLTSNKEHARIFFPFCGKEVDMAWLASIGHEIVGVEYVEDAVIQFFTEQNIEYNISQVGDYKLYTSVDKKIKIYCGDFFVFSNQYEAVFEHVWDRGALVALPADLRPKYIEVMLKLLNTSSFKYMLDTVTYNTELYEGPPHMVPLDEITHYFGRFSDIEKIDENFYKSYNEKLVGENQPVEVLYLISSINN